eukprot:Colp12_sorted_trinity150504_noHs@381
MVMQGNQTLATAAAYGDEQLTLSLLKNKADPNARSQDGYVPLCIAAFWGYDGIVKALLQHGADVNLTNTANGWSALHCATFQSQAKVVMLLLEKRPNVHMKDFKGRTAIDFASASEICWPFFAALGYKRSPMERLIELQVVSKNGTNYHMATDVNENQQIRNKWSGSVAALHGDVLGEDMRRQKDELANAAHEDVPPLVPWRF